MILQARNIHKNYGQLWVLKGVDLEIKQGEIASIVGPSGSGKSTLLHILGTLDHPNKGEVFINQQKINFLHEKEVAAFRNHHIGFVFQFHHLLPEFTALENVSIPGWMAGRKKKEVGEKASGILKTLGLGERLDNKPGALSGGEQQRVAVARALINDPKIIFADEPTGNLDSKTGDTIIDLLLNLARERKKTLLVVTHDNRLAARGDRELQMVDGKLA